MSAAPHSRHLRMATIAAEAAVQAADDEELRPRPVVCGVLRRRWFFRLHPRCGVRRRAGRHEVCVRVADRRHVRPGVCGAHGVGFLHAEYVATRPRAITADTEDETFAGVDIPAKKSNPRSMITKAPMNTHRSDMLIFMPQFPRLPSHAGGVRSRTRWLMSVKANIPSFSVFAQEPVAVGIPPALPAICA